MHAGTGVRTHGLQRLRLNRDRAPKAVSGTAALPRSHLTCPIGMHHPLSSSDGKLGPRRRATGYRTANASPPPAHPLGRGGETVRSLRSILPAYGAPPSA